MKIALAVCFASVFVAGSAMAQAPAALGAGGAGGAGAGGAFGSAPASAQSQWYVGAGVGSAQAKLGGSGTVTGNDSHQTSAKFFGGYQLTPIWGIEGQYVYLGKYNTNVGSYKPESWGLAATGTVPLSNNFYVMGKLGAAFNRLSGSNLGGGNKTDLLAGVGVGYNFNTKWGMRAEYENFGKMTKNTTNGGDIKGQNWAVSVKYSF
jgi:OOP family OmpA-OmpF porin